MILISRVRRVLGLLAVSVPLHAGCGESIETAPAVEPNAGPGVAAGGGKSDPKAPAFGPAGKTTKAAPEKAAEKK
ncbi:MAG: hypothetical protein P4L84_16625 [Isosphaeraceae bacterium]|nr:hypothetical protein [Isosphaeraceae bacterium]